MRVLTSPRLTFFTTVRTTWEVERFVPRLAVLLEQRGIHTTEVQLIDRFKALRLIAVQDSFYRRQIALARRLIAQRDPRDVDILALTLRLNIPLWTHDRDFEGIPHIRVVTTAELLAMIET